MELSSFVETTATQPACLYDVSDVPRILKEIAYLHVIAREGSFYLS
jgi:hypothetical protein